MTATKSVASRRLPRHNCPRRRWWSGGASGWMSPRPGRPTCHAQEQQVGAARQCVFRCAPRRSVRRARQEAAAACKAWASPPSASRPGADSSTQPRLCDWAGPLVTDPAHGMSGDVIASRCAGLAAQPRYRCRGAREAGLTSVGKVMVGRRSGLRSGQKASLLSNGCVLSLL